MTNIRSPQFYNDQTAWIDLTLSKAALMIVSIVILTAFYQLATDLTDTQVQDQLDNEAFRLKTTIDNIGSISPDSIRYNSTHTFNAKNINRAVITGEYVQLESTHNDILLRAVKPLTFKTLPLNNSELQHLISSNFYGNDGTKEEPIDSNVAAVLEVLSIKGREEVILNTGKIVQIEKTVIYLKNDTEVTKIELVLVYQ